MHPVLPVRGHRRCCRPEQRSRECDPGALRTVPSRARAHRSYDAVEMRQPFRRVRGIQLQARRAVCVVSRLHRVAHFMPETMILSSSAERGRIVSDDEICVATPLDAIYRLEHRHISTVVLVGEYATNRELAAFLGEFYPSVRVHHEERDVAAS